MCMPEPGWVVNGWGMNVAQMPWLSATSRITVRKVMMLSAVLSASAYLRSISCWPGPPSWWLNSTEMPIASSIVIASRRKSEPLDWAVWSKKPLRSTGTGSTPSTRHVLEQVELDLGVGVEGEPLVGRLATGSA